MMEMWGEVDLNISRENVLINNTKKIIQNTDIAEVQRVTALA